MSEAFYKVVRAIGSAVFRVASAPLILHPERAARSGAYILAANHDSAFDSALLIASTPRVIYWLSILEIFQHTLARWFLSSMLAEPLDRSRVDSQTMRKICRSLRAGRVVGIFPEGGLRTGAASVLAGGTMHDGVARLAEVAHAPVLPVVVLGGAEFRRWTSWLPCAGTRWAVAFGEPIPLPPGDRKSVV